MKSDIKIMIVEDEFVTANGTKKVLEDLGYSVSAMVFSGEDGIKKAEEGRPDLVLMDIQLEGEMDGVEAAGIIHSKFGVPSIFLTAYADEKTLEGAKITEPYGYLLKPFEKKELHCNIEMALYKHKSEIQLKKLNEEILEKEELKAIMALAVTANHEINNPLTGVIAGVELLQLEDEMSKEERENILNTVHEQALRISEVIKRFAKISKPVKKKYSGDTDMIDLENSQYREY